jgi:hypothetical protein
MGTQIECLAVGNSFLEKETQDGKLRAESHAAFELD